MRGHVHVGVGPCVQLAARQAVPGGVQTFICTRQARRFGPVEPNQIAGGDTGNCQ